MDTAIKAWRASFTRRWHTNYDLCDTVDYVSGHQQRVALLALQIKPNMGREAIIWALIHDQGEQYAGADLAGPAKRRRPDIREMVEHEEMDGLERQGFRSSYNVSGVEKELIRICDKLDAILWAHKHGISGADEWQHEKREIQAKADLFGFANKVREILEVV